MSWKTMKLSVKLPLTFASVLLLMVGAALVGFLQLERALDTFGTDVAAASAHERQVRMMEMAFKEQVQEWKNVLLRGKDAQQLDKYWAAFQKKENEVSAAAKTLGRHVHLRPMKKPRCTRSRGTRTCFARSTSRTRSCTPPPPAKRFVPS